MTRLCLLLTAAAILNSVPIVPCAALAQRSRSLPLNESMSVLQAEASLFLFAEELAAEEQLPGSLQVGYTGTFMAAVDSNSNELTLFDESIASALRQAEPMMPGPEGSTEADLANYAATFKVAEELSLGEVAEINLGTLVSLEMDAAVRDLSAELFVEDDFPLDDAGLFDATAIDLLVNGHADVAGRLVTRADNAADYVITLVAIELLAADTPEITDVSGNFFSRELTIDFAARLSLEDEIVDNEPLDGQLRRDAERLELDVPVDIEIIQPILDGVLDIELRMSGNFILDPLLADLDGDRDMDGEDFDLLQLAVDSGATNTLLDIGNDGVVDSNDTVQWLAQAEIPAGDADLDGIVSFSDFLLLSNGFGLAGSWRDGDFDQSGTVDFSDFLILSANFGQMSRAFSTVPEPSGNVLWIGLLPMLVAIRRRAR